MGSRGTVCRGVGSCSIVDSVTPLKPINSLTRHALQCTTQCEATTRDAEARPGRAQRLMQSYAGDLAFRHSGLYPCRRQALERRVPFWHACDEHRSLHEE